MSNKKDPKENSYKILTIGESGVGKTAILKRYVEDKFPKHHLSTIGIDYLSKDITIYNKKIKLRVWDTAGQERYRNITTHTYKEVRHGNGVQLYDGIALIFDLTDENSFNQINDWMDQIYNNTDKKLISLILIGNKSDLINERKIQKEKGEEMAENLHIKYFETSALTGEGINQAFEYLAKLIFRVRNPDANLSRNISLSKEDGKELDIKKRKCC